LTKVKKDRDVILSIEAINPSYRGLAAYIAAVGHETSHEFFNEETITDARVLGLFGEAAYLNGDHKSAQLEARFHVRLGTKFMLESSRAARVRKSSPWARQFLSSSFLTTSVDTLHYISN
jgi:hypothetical protein